MDLPLTARSDTLAWPLGWAGPDLLALVAAQPSVGLHLLTAERPRLHLLAFVLAMDSQPVSAELIDQTLTRPMRDVVARLGFADLRGLRRLLGRIPGRVLEREQYQLIAKLLSDQSAAQVLYHAPEISPELLANLNSLPEALRSSVIVDAIAHLPGAAQHVVIWTEIAAGRLRQAASKIQEKLGRCASSAELRTELEKVLDSLPALELAPPKLVQYAMRIDTPAAIRQLGKKFNNCLTGFIDAEIDGTSHVYHWRAGHAEAVCEVTRVGNLGWFLGSHLGSDNDPLEDELASQIRTAFASVGIHSLKIIGTYDDLYFAVGRRQSQSDNDRSPPDRRRRGRYHPD